jgi:NAD(P)-dependent dehydrogenase (short-subunit alcohol dehydrogenase family)
VPPNAEEHTPAFERLAGKRAIVSGAARGIGRAILESFAAAGASVVALDVLEEEGSAACRAVGPAATFCRLDVTNEDDWKTLTARLEKDPPDVLVNNAGGLLSAATLHEHTLADWRGTLDLNLTSAFLGMRAVIPLMLARGSGSIVNVASISGVVGQDDAPAYQAAKAGLVLLTQNAAVTYAKQGIRVNSLSPSVVATRAADLEDERSASFVARVPLGRPATPAEIAAAAVFLASDESSYVTGANLPVDGGYLA